MLQLSVIHEDENILVVDKQSGVVMHPFDFSDEVTLLAVISQYAPEILSIDNPKKLQDGRTINLGGMVHKLDRETSGIVVFAKNKKTSLFIYFLEKLFCFGLYFNPNRCCAT